MDTLMSYERMLGNYPEPLAGASCGGSEMNPLHSSMIPRGSGSGSALGAFDMCICSARQILHIINCLAPADYEFLEPSIAVSLNESSPFVRY